MLTGTIINTLAIVAGSLIGLAIQAVTKHSADDVSADSLGGRLQALVMQGMALCVLYIGISGSLKGENTLVIIISIALGAVIGELLDLDAKMHALGDWVQKKTARLVHTGEGSPSVADGFVTASLLFCVGAMAIVGSLSSGILLDHSTLISKGVIDPAVCLPMAATMGIGVPFCGVSLVVYEGILSVLASLVGSFLTDAVVTEVAVTGSTLLLAVGTNLLGVTDIKVANLIPAAFVPILLVPAAMALGLM